jgi:predicted anti-sigma-YlaC factor YlaD
MNCEQYQELISADLDAELSAEEEPVLWEHLAHCAECRLWRREQLAIRGEFQRWPEETFPSMAAEAALLPTTWRKVYHIPRVLAWAAVAVLLIQGALVTSKLVRSHDTEAPIIAVSPEETVETIVLTAKDRVSFSTTVNPLMIGKPVTNPGEDGG